MKKIIIIVIYLIGCFLSYIEIKEDFQKEFDGKWTKQDRAFAITISSLSWLSVCAISISSFILDLKCEDEPANW